MRIAITGATGFLGKHLTLKVIEQKHDVVALGRNTTIGSELKAMGAEFYATDLNDLNKMILALNNCDAVVHCAGLSSPWGTKNAFYQANVVGTQNLLKAIESSNVRRLIHISTPSIYFDYTNRLNISEEDPLPKQMVNTYAETKLEAENAVTKASLRGLETIIIRPRALFGPGDTTLFPRLIKANNRIGIPTTTFNPIITDVTYIDNVVDAILLSLKAPQHCLGNAYNISNGEPQNLEGLLNKLFSSLSTPLRRPHIPYPIAYALATLSEGAATLTKKEPSLTRYGLGVLSYSLTLDITRAKEDLGYSPRVTIQEGINRFSQWWKHD